MSIMLHVQLLAIIQSIYATIRRAGYTSLSHSPIHRLIMPLSVGHNLVFFQEIWKFPWATVLWALITLLRFSSTCFSYFRNFSRSGPLCFSYFRNIFWYNSTTTLLRADSVTLESLEKLHRANPQHLLLINGTKTWNRLSLSLNLLSRLF